MGGHNLYNYVENCSSWVDIFGLYNGEGVRELGVYEVFHTHNLDPTEYTKTDEYQFAKANESLHNRFESDPEFAKKMEAKYPGIVEFVKPNKLNNFEGASPPGTTWHHNSDTPGLLQLVDRDDHKKFHKIYHPDGEGGRKKWGGGNTCRK